jgi:hypothetical protein
MNSAGNWGFGTNAPIAHLDVRGGSIHVSDAATLYTRMNGATDTATTRAGISFDGAGQTLNFYTANTLCATFQSNGKFRCINTIDCIPSSGGAIQFFPGDATHTGYVNFLGADLTAKGYIGYADFTGGGNTLNYNNSMGTAGHSFNNSVYLGGYNSSLAGRLTILEISSIALQTWTTNGDYNAGVFNRLGTNVGSIWCTATGTQYGSLSDIRLKTNIADAGDAGRIIDAIRIRQFDWKQGGAHVGFGLVAQELFEHFPDAVTLPDPANDDDEHSNPWMTDQSRLVPLLIKEIQSLRGRLAKLEKLEKRKSERKAK